MSERCGSWRVIERDHGDPSLIRWCNRTEGPCPYPGTDEHQGSERKCATSPGKRLLVSWHPDELDYALRTLVACRKFGTHLDAGERAIAVAIDALRACQEPEDV